ncbi:MAG: hypothetical protein KGM49_05805 [Sphingomonadales bacterium]|nr:hypothetical protein [Sphingomonadales bacterium]
MKEDHDVWLVADTHFGRQPSDRLKVSGLTGDQMDQLIADNWICLVKPNDVVWHLGDVGDVAWLAGLPGAKCLVSGNDRDEPRAKISTSFIKSYKRHMLRVDDSDVELVHIPREARSSGLVLHGHLHARSHPESRFACVSVDQCNFAPIRLSEAMERFEQNDMETG